MTEKPGGFTLDLSLQVGKYDIQKLLGKGATGTVYLARDTFTGNEVALKNGWMPHAVPGSISGAERNGPRWSASR